jgi:hypothetical protein
MNGRTGGWLLGAPALFLSVELLGTVGAPCQESHVTAARRAPSIPVIRTYPPPPTGFRALEATAEQRARYGIPSPPGQHSGRGYSIWREIFVRSLTYVTPKYNVEAIKGRPLFKGPQPRTFGGTVQTQQSAGLSASSSLGYEEVAARWIVPVPLQNGTSLVGISISNNDSVPTFIGTSQSMTCTPACPGPASYAAVIGVGVISVPLYDFPVNPGDVMMGFLQTGFGSQGNEVIATIVNLNLNSATEISVSFAGLATGVEFGAQTAYTFQPCRNRFCAPAALPFPSHAGVWFWDMTVCGPGAPCAGAADAQTAYQLVNMTGTYGNLSLVVQQCGTSSIGSQPATTDYADSWMLISWASVALPNGC